MAWLAHQRLGYNYRLSEINAAWGQRRCRGWKKSSIAAGRWRAMYMERLMTNNFLILPTLAG